MDTPTTQHDCELEMDTSEVDYYLETGEVHADLDTCMETMLALAKKEGKAVCLFTVYRSEADNAKSV